MFQATCPCGASFPLEEFQRGARLRCPECNAHFLDTGAGGAGAEAADYLGAEVFELEKLYLRLHIFCLGMRLTVSDRDGKPLMLVRRPMLFRKNLGVIGIALIPGLLLAALGFALVGRADGSLTGIAMLILLFVLAAFVPIVPMVLFAILAPRRDITFALPSAPDVPILTLKQAPLVETRKAHYYLLDAEGKALAVVKQAIGTSFVTRRRMWHFTGPDRKMLCSACDDWRIFQSGREDRDTSLLAPLRGDCIIRAADGDTVAGTLRPEGGFSWRQVLDMSADDQHWVDRRLSLAAAVLLMISRRG